MTLLDQYGRPSAEIERRGLAMARVRMAPTPDLSEDERQVLTRIVWAVGDEAIAGAVRFSQGAVEIGIEALVRGVTIVADVRMVQMGVSKVLLARAGITVVCSVDDPRVAESAKMDGITRSAAAMRELAGEAPKAIVAIGNAPTALLALLDLVDDGLITPALVIGMPVGFVACAEAKEELVKRSVPYITITGNRGGSSAAAATVNALLLLAYPDANAPERL